MATQVKCKQIVTKKTHKQWKHIYATLFSRIKLIYIFFILKNQLLKLDNLTLGETDMEIKLDNFILSVDILEDIWVIWTLKNML